MNTISSPINKDYIKSYFYFPNGDVRSYRFKNEDSINIEIKTYFKTLYPWIKSTKEGLYCFNKNIQRQPICEFCWKDLEFDRFHFTYKVNCENKCHKKYKDKQNKLKAKLNKPDNSIKNKEDYFNYYKDEKRFKALKNKGRVYKEMREYLTTFDFPKNYTLLDKLYVLDNNLENNFPRCKYCGKIINGLPHWSLKNNGKIDRLNFCCAKHKELYEYKESIYNIIGTSNYFEFNDENILKVLWNSKDIEYQKITKYWLGLFPDIKKYLDNRFDDSKSIIETLTRMKYKIYIRPVCPVCGKSLIFLTSQNKKFFLKHCSYQCSAKDNKTKEKQYRSKFKNNSWTASKLEKLAISLLSDKYGFDNICKEYKDKRYPYRCDFYIKSLDLFIEIQGHWGHGPHPFDKDNSEDIALLEKWKEKTKVSKYYEKAIIGWTIRDVEKRNIAKQNNLRYLEIFYTYKDFSNKNFLLEKIEEYLKSINI